MLSRIDNEALQFISICAMDAQAELGYTPLVPTPREKRYGCTSPGGRFWCAPLPALAVGVRHPHRVAAFPRRLGDGGGALGCGVAFPRWLRAAGGGLGGGKAPSCSRACSARTPFGQRMCPVTLSRT